MREESSEVATARPLSRRGFLLGGAGAAAAVGLPGGLVWPSVAGAEDGLIKAPKPIPGGLPVGLPPPFDVIHLFLPGPTKVTLPFSGLPLQGLDVEPTTITDFKGVTAMAYLVGTAEGSDGHEYGLEVDLRVSEGEYMTANGTRERGLFALI